ncbi:hypothetical protein L2E82_35482 [Cichorium intybus]|uniref:Uncharacterized protein n=1 Tax=Cichorium intybus TaxID=13427 RepID=A0ACB9BNY4_CICIN|nr:hypothetical protein L2E82_35482 [Cichorium intybus]
MELTEMWGASWCYRFSPSDLQSLILYGYIVCSWRLLAPIDLVKSFNESISKTFNTRKERQMGRWDLTSLSVVFAIPNYSSNVGLVVVGRSMVWHGETNEMMLLEIVASLEIMASIRLELEAFT